MQCSNNTNIKYKINLFSTQKLIFNRLLVAKDIRTKNKNYSVVVQQIVVIKKLQFVFESFESTPNTCFNL